MFSPTSRPSGSACPHHRDFGGGRFGAFETNLSAAPPPRCGFPPHRTIYLHGGSSRRFRASASNRARAGSRWGAALLVVIAHGGRVGALLSVAPKIDCEGIPRGQPLSSLPQNNCCMPPSRSSPPAHFARRWKFPSAPLLCWPPFRPRRSVLWLLLPLRGWSQLPAFTTRSCSPS